MKTKIKVYLIIAFMLIGLTTNIFNNSKKTRLNDRLSAKKKSVIINKITEIYNEYYPLIDVAKKMTKYINKKHKKGKYENFTNIFKFTSQLTKDLRYISKDYHIKVYPYKKIPADLQKETRLGSAEDNYGFQKVEHLLGNIGYINLTSFNNTKSAGPTAIAAMSFVAHCDALIIDLRSNGGGDESMARFISSYFFDKSTHLYNSIVRKDKKTEQVWTQEWVPGTKILKAPVYILLSNYSYSSSEVLAYQLQQLGRAILIGEKTRGGAHGVTYRSYKELSINLKIPYTQDMNPYSKTNYIKGVIPDVEVSADKAFIVANIEAAKKLLKTEKNKKKKYKLNWVLSGYKIALNPVVLKKKALSEYLGTYKNIKIILEYGRLYSTEKNKIKQELIPMGKDLFKYRVQKEEKFRIQFSRDKNGKVIKFHWLDSDGDKYPAKKRTNN